MICADSSLFLIFLIDEIFDLHCICYRIRISKPKACMLFDFETAVSLVNCIIKNDCGNGCSKQLQYLNSCMSLFVWVWKEGTLQHCMIWDMQALSIQTQVQTGINNAVNADNTLTCVWTSNLRYQQSDKSFPANGYYHICESKCIKWSPLGYSSSLHSLSCAITAQIEYCTEICILQGAHCCITSHWKRYLSILWRTRSKGGEGVTVKKP